MPPQSKEPEIRSNGVDAMSHAYLQYPPLRCDISEALGVTYDDGNKLLLVPTSGKVYSWSVPSEPPGDPNIIVIKEGPVLSARFSLDKQFLAILRSNTEVEFVNRETGASFKQPCKGSKDRILSLFWTDCPDCDVVFVTTGGLELYALQRISLKLVDRKRQDVSWFVYTHESRLVLLASGPQCKALSGYQFSSAGTVKVPKFEANLSKTDGSRKLVLASDNVHIATMYGRLYCLQVDPAAKLLHMYRFYRDAVISQGSLPVYSSNVSASVVDNVLLVHQIDSKVVLLYDVLAVSKVPITAPLPLLIRGSSTSKRGLAGLNDDGESNTASLYGEGWFFLNPDLVLDLGRGLLWKIKLDLEAVAASSSDVPSVLGFLQRRRQEAAKAKHLCMELVRSVILEKRSLSLISTALSVITTTCSHAKRTTHLQSQMVYAAAPFSAVPLVLTPGVQSAALRSGYVATTRRQDAEESNADSARSNGSHEKAGENSSSIRRWSSPVLSPFEVYKDIFAAVEEEMTVESNFLAAIILEYIRCASLENLVVPPELHALLVDLLVREQRYDKLHQLVSDKILEPSKQLALQLLAVQSRQIQQLGMDMLKQAHAHKEFISRLLRGAGVLEALRYIRQNKLEVESPAAFLEAAAAHDNHHQVLFSVLRFLCDFVPGFQQTEDFDMYYSLVKQNSS